MSESWPMVHIGVMPRQLAGHLRRAPSDLPDAPSKEPPLVELDQPRNVQCAVEYLERAKPADELGSRNERTNRVAFRVGDFAISEQKCIELMTDHWLPRCHAGWSIDDMLPPIQSAYKRRKTPRGSGLAEVQFPPLPDASPVGASGPSKFNLKAPDGERSSNLDRTIRWNDKPDFRNLPPALIEGMLNPKEIMIVGGIRGTGKSAVRDRMFASILTGAPFGNHFTRKGGALILSGEGHGGADARMEALRRAVGKADLPLNVVTTDLNLRFDAGAERLLRHCEQFQSDYGILPSVVCLDTWTSLTPGLRTNDEDAVTPVIYRVRQIMTITGAAFVIVAHQGKDTTRGIRGSSAIEDAADAVLIVDGKNRTLTATKMREFELPTPLGYELVAVEVGRRRDGTPVTSVTANILSKPKKNLSAIEAELDTGQRDFFLMIRSVLAARPSGTRLTVQEIGREAVAGGLIGAASEKDATDSARGRLKRLQSKGLMSVDTRGWALATDTGFGNEVVQ